MTPLAGCERSQPIPGLRPLALAQEAGVRVSVILIAAAFALGLALRIMAAQGELWLDEMMSLDLVAPLTSPDQVFWNVSHDNNHFLNSLWMMLVGQTQAPFVYRILSLILSMIVMLVATALGWRISPASAVAAAWITACSYVFVDYGSEARGYAGLMLAMLVAIDLSGRLVDRTIKPHLSDRSHRALRWQLGIAIALGACAHLTMVAGAVVLGVSAAIRLKQAGRTATGALDTAFGLFRPSLILLLPVAACLGLGVFAKGEFTIGGSVPFTFENFAEGYGGLLAEFLGLRQIGPPWLGIVATAALLLAALGLRLLARRWIALAITALAFWPAFIVVARVSSVEHARYFLAVGVVLPVFLWEITGRLWAGGPWARAGAFVLMALVCGGQVDDLRTLLIHHRGAPATVVGRMGRDGPAEFIARYPTMTEPMIASLAKRLNLTLTPSGQAESCIHPAAWIVWDTDFGEAIPESHDIIRPACSSRYTKVESFPAALWSGRSWTLFRREP